MPATIEALRTQETAVNNEVLLNEGRLEDYITEVTLPSVASLTCSFVRSAG